MKKLTDLTWSHWLFLALACLGAGLRLGLALSWPEALFQPDSLDYFATLLHWEAEGGLYVSYLKTPVYPLFLLLVTKTLGLAWIAVVQQGINILAVVFSGWLVTRLFPTHAGRTTGGIFALLCSLSPSQTVYASHVLTEALAFPALALCLGAFVFWDKKKTLVRLLPLAAALVLAVLLRPAFLSIAAAAVLAVMIALPRRAFVHFLFLCGLCLILALPWMSYNKKVHTRFSLSNAGAVALVHSYGHLLAMDSDFMKPYKETLAPALETSLEERKSLTKDQLLFEGANRTFGPDNFFTALEREHGLTIPQMDPVLKRLVGEGIKEHPRDAAWLFGQRLWFFIARTPADCEKSLGYLWGQWLQPEGWPWFEKHYQTAYQVHGLPSPAAAQRRFEQAGVFTGLFLALGNMYSLVFPLLFWMSLILSPVSFYRFGIQNNPALFPLLMLSAYLVQTSLLVPPEPRFFAPAVGVTLFLLALEAMTLLGRTSKENS